MATKPTPGGSDGTYGTELNAFLDVSLASDGKVKDGAVLAAGVQFGDDPLTIVNLDYVATSSNTMHDSQGGFNNVDLNTNKTVVYTKYFTGTTDADSETLVAHSISTGISKILHVSASIKHTDGKFSTSDYLGPVGTANKWSLRWDGTNVILIDLGSDFQSQPYVIKIDYTVG